MTKRIKAKGKKGRRLGVSLWGRAKDSYNYKNYPPGQHGASGSTRQKSDYGKQLSAKQRLKFYYGNITEKHFRRVYKEAVRLKGDTGENLIGLLERRLDAIIYRANFVPTVFSARQLVSHKHVLVNGQAVNVASYKVQIGDVIEVRDRAKEIPMVIEAIQKMEREIPDYLTVDPSKKTVSIHRIPNLADVPFPVIMEPHLIIEYYSR